MFLHNTLAIVPSHVTVNNHLFHFFFQKLATEAERVQMAHRWQDGIKVRRLQFSYLTSTFLF